MPDSREPQNEPTPGDKPRRFTPAAPSGLQRFWRALSKRPDAGHIGVGLLVGLLGFAAVVQVRVDEDDALANARRDDLVQILDGLRRQSERLDDQVAELEADRRDLVSGANTEAEALAQAQERAQTTGILAGTVPATGPGIIMTITDPDRQVSSVLMYRAVQELRDAGAEAIQITGEGNDSAVRVVLDTYFLGPQDGAMNISGEMVEPPYTIVAIGDAGVLAGTMSFAQGILASIEGLNADNGGQPADATVTEYNELTIDVLHEPEEPQYARPAPEGEDDDDD